MGLFDLAAAISQPLINRRTDKLNMIRQNAMNMKMAEYQYSKDLEMWNRQNEYNSPKSQMERFGAAGLNPNLMYGQGNTGNATTLPKYQAPEMRASLNPLNILGMVSAYQDIRIKEASVDNMKAERRIKEAEGTIRIAEANVSQRLAEAKAGIAEEEWRSKGMDRVYQETEFNRWFEQREDGKWYIKPSQEENYKTYLWQKWVALPSAQLEKYNADIAATNSLKDLREQEKFFNSTGGKFFNPILRGLGLVFGR